MADFQSQKYQQNADGQQHHRVPHDPHAFWSTEERSYVFSRLNGLAAFYEQFVQNQHQSEPVQSDTAAVYAAAQLPSVNVSREPNSPRVSKDTNRVASDVPVRVAQPSRVYNVHNTKHEEVLEPSLRPVSLAFMPGGQPPKAEGPTAKNHKEHISHKKQHQHTTHATKRKRPKKRTAQAVFALAILINLVGLGFIIKASLQNKQILHESVAHADQANTTPSITPADLPEETPPSEAVYTNYAVAPDEPRYLQIPSLGVKARVLGLGLTASGAFDAPKNIFDTGWYKSSAKPGLGAGAVLIDGHSTGLSKEGIFTKLGSVATGQKITLTRGDGKVLSYSVVKVQKLPNAQVDMSSLLLSVDPKRQGLNLITCSGNFNQRDFTFSERTLVYALIDK